MLAALRRNVEWRAIPLAGLAGGTVYLVIVLIFSGGVLGLSPTVVLRYFGSLLIGPDALMQGGIGLVAAGLAVHYVLSLVFALIISLVVHRWGMLVGVILGGLMGLGLYGINVYTLTALFPWFFAINSVLLLICHIVYGAVVGGVYEYFDRFDAGLSQEVRR
ncbi:MAG: hypothetical protein IT298_00460 [Chloroflexi bacterium]|nr:hypothetical protein [Anaerolineae bacterium]MCC6564209.1 hypothetical protein [Chloroflexota bacterium]